MRSDFIFFYFFCIHGFDLFSTDRPKRERRPPGDYWIPASNLTVPVSGKKGEHCYTTIFWFSAATESFTNTVEVAAVVVSSHRHK